MMRPSQRAGKLRPSKALRILNARAHEIERRRDAAAGAGDRELARRLSIELEAAADDLDRAMRVELRRMREARAVAAAEPSDDLRGGLTLVRADVPSDRVEVGGGDVLSVPGGAYARPVWALGIDRALMFTAARYAAWVELAAGGGQVKCVDPSAIRVDGGGGGSSPETQLLWIAGRIAAAHRALETCSGLSALRSHQADRRGPIPARRLIDLVAVEGRTLCEVLRMFGWTASGRNKRAIRGVLVDALDAIAAEWSGSAEGGAGRSERWCADGADLVVGKAGTY